MTIEELLAREGIRHTMASYTMAGDRLREEEFVAVFTEDAVLESENVSEQDSFRYEGRAAIRAWIGRWRQSAEIAPDAPRASFVRHHLSTSLIEFTGGNTAKARTYWTAYTDIGPDHCGNYIDSFRKTGDRWLIAHRRVRLDWRSPASLFTSVVLRAR
jgi:hypothetical protein